jgi:hypothetical protein
MKAGSMLVGAGAIVVLLGLTACASVPTPHPTSSAFPLPRPGTVVATSQLDDAADGFRGTATLTRVKDDYRFSITPSSPASTPVALALSPEPDADVCGAPLVQVLDAVSGSSPASAPIYISGLVTGGLTAPPADRWLLDPTLFRTLVVVRTGAPNTTCASSTAPIVWRIQPFRADLTPEDGGAVDGASGAPTLVQGRLRAYTVRMDDTLDRIADRFGLTLDELLYLNPLGVDPDHPQDLQAGTALNLDAAHRGQRTTD